MRPAIHPYGMVNTAYFWLNGAVYSSFGQLYEPRGPGLKWANKIHPEIVDIPGGIEHYGDFHDLVDKTCLTAQKKWGFEQLM